MSKKLELTIKDTANKSNMSVLCMAGEPGVGKTHNAEVLPMMWELIAGEPVKQIFFQMYDGAGKDKLLYDYDMPSILNSLNSQLAVELFFYRMIEIFILVANTLSLGLLRPLLTPLERYKNTQVECIKCKGTDSIREGVLYQAARHSLTGKVVLILDEIDKARPEVDTFLLDFFQNGRLSDPLLGDVKANFENIIVILTTNEQRELNDALYRRMRYWALPYPSRTEELERLQTKHPEEFEILGEEKVKFLINVAKSYRETKGIKRKIVTNQIGRLMRDLVTLLPKDYSKLSAKEKSNNEIEVNETICSWFSPYFADWDILNKIKVDGKQGLTNIYKKLIS